jgi:hypothetical protein
MDRPPGGPRQERQSFTGDQDGLGHCLGYSVSRPTRGSIHITIGFDDGYAGTYLMRP